MLEHMKTHHTSKPVKVTISIKGTQKVSYLPEKNIEKLEAFLEKYSDTSNKSITWETLANDRIAKYKKSGLVLRGMRYREGISQKDLAKKSKVNQTEISKIENGKRAVGEIVAKRLAKALNFDFKLLIDA